jgi:hypothetical protein
VSAITAECCPPSEWNGVRDGVEYARNHGTPLITVTPGTGGRPGAINAVFTGDAGRSRSRACLQWKSSSR